MPPAARTLAGLTALAICTSGCTTLGPDFKAPAAAASSGYAMSGDPTPAGIRQTDVAGGRAPWWRDYGSPELDQVIRLAFANNPTIAEVKATLERAKAEAAATAGGRLPQLDLNGGARRARINTKTLGFTGFPPRTLDLYSVGAQVSYDLDLFGGARRSAERDQAHVAAAAHEADAAYLTLASNVAGQAVRIAALRAQIATTEAVVADDRQIYTILRQADAVGGKPRTAGAGALAELLQDEAALPPLRQELALARHQLALLVGRAPADWTAPDFDAARLNPPKEIPISLPSSLVRRRPDILAAEAELHAATSAIGVAAANRYPDLRLTASLTQTATNPVDLFGYSASSWNLVSGLAAPVFSGGALKAKQAAAEAGARTAMARYQQTVLRAFVQVSDSLAALGADEQEMAVLRLAELAATTSARDTQSAYALGGVAQIEVLENQRTVNRVRNLIAQAEGQRMQNLVTLSAATAAEWRIP
jgi:NodT family efflux transporter outer membrane factor (OMF) lipoprotein